VALFFCGPDVFPIIQLTVSVQSSKQVIKD